MASLELFLLCVGGGRPLIPDDPESLSPVDESGACRFIWRVMHGVPVDAYRRFLVSPHAALFRAGEMRVCWAIRPDGQENLPDLCAIAGMDSPYDRVPLPGVDGWRCVQAQDAPPYSVEELLRLQDTSDAAGNKLTRWSGDLYRAP